MCIVTIFLVAFYGCAIFSPYLYCLVGCLSMIALTHAVLGVLYACVFYFVLELVQHS